MPKRVLVFGAGAMGSLVGGLLSRRHEVTLVGRRPHVEAIRQGGLRIHGRTELHVRVEAVEDVSGVEPPDLVIVTVKSFDTEAAARALQPFSKTSLFLSLQNGLGNAECMSASAERVVAGVTYQGVTFNGPGEITHAGLGDTLLGPFRGADDADADALAGLLSESGLPTAKTQDIDAVLWSKAVVNACFNPLTALLRTRSGVMATSDPLMEACGMIVEEAVRVASAHGIELDAETLTARVRAVSIATAENRSSMLQDLERGRPQEIDAINGAIARLGREREIPCPVNHLLTLLVHAASALRSAPA